MLAAIWFDIRPSSGRRRLLSPSSLGRCFFFLNWAKTQLVRIIMTWVFCTISCFNFHLFTVNYKLSLFGQDLRGIVASPSLFSIRLKSSTLTRWQLKLLCLTALSFFASSSSPPSHHHPQHQYLITSFSSLLLRPPSSCLIISSCNFCRDLFRSLASRFFANVCWTLNMKHITMEILKLELQTAFYFHRIPVPGGSEFQRELWHSFTNLVHLDIKRN